MTNVNVFFSRTKTQILRLCVQPSQYLRMTGLEWYEKNEKHRFMKVFLVKLVILKFITIQRLSLSITLQWPQQFDLPNKKHAGFGKDLHENKIHSISNPFEILKNGETFCFNWSMISKSHKNPDIDTSFQITLHLNLAELRSYFFFEENIFDLLYS